jgi:hypothetical protein
MARGFPAGEFAAVSAYLVALQERSQQAMPSLFRGLLTFVLVAVLIVASEPTRYRSVSVDSSGRLHVVLDSGREIVPPKASYQSAFGDPAISPDHRTVGWLVLYPYPYAPGARYKPYDTLSGALALYRNGRVIHEFHTEQTFYDTQFQSGGKHVAYSTGPTHGGAAECILRDVDSGKVIARWSVKNGEDPPAWARTLRV